MRICDLLALVPERFRSRLLQRHETIKFLVVGGTCYLITVALTYLLKLTVLTSRPTTALVIATVVATVVSYVLNREWSFRSRGGRQRHIEIFMFSFVNVIAVGITATPQYVARYVFLLEMPHVSRVTQEISDYFSGLVLGVGLAMIFRLWAFRLWVFPANSSKRSNGPRGPSGPPRQIRQTRLPGQGAIRSAHDRAARSTSSRS